MRGEREQKKVPVIINASARLLHSSLGFRVMKWRGIVAIFQIPVQKKRGTFIALAEV
jgi:hypothetical protein